jgi:hypothetical protein
MRVVASPPWTSEEEEKASIMAVAGHSASEVAEAPGRTKGAVAHRAYKLGVVFGKAKVMRK